MNIDCQLSLMEDCIACSKFISCYDHHKDSFLAAQDNEVHPGSSSGAKLQLSCFELFISIFQPNRCLSDALIQQPHGETCALIVDKLPPDVDALHGCLHCILQDGT